MLTLIATILSSSLGFASGFSGGSEMSAVPVSGWMTLTCHGDRGNYQRRSGVCEAEVLLPYEMDYFVPSEEEQGMAITNIEISRVQKNGKVVKQSRRFLDKKGHSRHFNLWVRSLTQRPLLNYGANTLSYKLLSKREVLKEGEFVVDVIKGEPRQCRPDHITVWGEMGCNFQSYCRDYFSRQNYCL